MKKIDVKAIMSKLFEWSIFLKGLEGVFEIIGGAFLVYSVKTNKLVQMVLEITKHELEQDPNDFLANKLVEVVKNINPGVSFGVVYLLAHGLIKTFLSVALLKGKIWAYPLGIYIWFTLAILLLIKFFTTLSPLYLLLSFLDVVVAILTIAEYRKKLSLICKDN